MRGAGSHLSAEVAQYSSPRSAGAAGLIADMHVSRRISVLQLFGGFVLTAVLAGAAWSVATELSGSWAGSWSGSWSGSGANTSEPAPTAVPPIPDEAKDNGWPRDFEAEGRVVRVFQPQIESWKDYERLVFTSAIAVAPSANGSADPDARAFGTMRVSAATEVSLADRLVVLTDRRIESITFTDVDEDEAAELSRVVTAAMPARKQQTIALDRVIAALEPDDADVRKVHVNTAPPRIIWSNRDAILVNFIGKPRFESVSGEATDLLFAINTNWDVFLEPASGRYYLLNDGAWLATDNLERGPWTAAVQLPAAIARLPKDANWSDVAAALPARAVDSVPAVYVTSEPTELIVTQGQPVFEAIPSTRLLLATNTENDIVYDGRGKQYYLLAAGRWFRANSLGGPWNDASATLPAEFQRIPEDSNAGDLLASVPGTAAADAAAVLASIPQKAEVDRKAVTIAVTYDGTPDFRPIARIGVRYAANSPFDVFLVDGKYYCCSDAVWFVSSSPTGPWAVADFVPPAIYEIPADFPRHNVTYVRVYQSTPTVVVSGYTAGYWGATVASTGVVMFGLGVIYGGYIDNDDWCWPYFYRPYYFSYGCGAVWHHGCGGFVTAGHRYGPYGGAGHCAHYRAGSERYSRGGQRYGAAHELGFRSAFNPSVDVRGARVGNVVPYASWTRGVAQHGDRLVRAGAQYGAATRAAATPAPNWANGKPIARMRDGDMYADRDGTVYRKGEKMGEKAGGKAGEKAGEKNWARVGDVPRRAPLAPANAATATTKKPADRKPESREPATPGKPGGAKESGEKPTGTRPADAAPTREKPRDSTPQGRAPSERKPDESRQRPTATPPAKRPPTTVRPVPTPPPAVARDASARDRGNRGTQSYQSFGARGGWNSGWSGGAGQSPSRGTNAPSATPPSRPAPSRPSGGGRAGGRR